MRVPEQVDHLVPDHDWPLLAERLKLSDRELEIAKLVVLDLKEFAIAIRLGISSHTVHTHLDRLYRKLGVGSRLQLVVRLASEYIVLVRSGAAEPLCRKCVGVMSTVKLTAQ